MRDERVEMPPKYEGLISLADWDYGMCHSNFTIPYTSLRGGLKHEGVWMWSLGMGTRFRNFTFDYAVVIHPYLNNQLRGSFGASW